MLNSARVNEKNCPKIFLITGIKYILRRLHLPQKVNLKFQNDIRETNRK